MSFEKRHNWLTKNQGRIAVAVAVAAIGAWGCQATVNTQITPTEGNVALGQNGKAGTLPTNGTAGAQNGGQTGGQTANNGSNTAANGGNGSGLANQPAGGEDKPAAPVNGPVDPTNMQPVGEDAPPTGVAGVAAPTLAFNTATPNAAPIKWTNKAVVVDPAVAAAFPKGEATIVGRIVDEAGKPAKGVPVITDKEKTTTNDEGWYQVKADAAPDVAIRVGGNDAGYIPFDDFLGVYPKEMYRYDTQVLSLDDNVTTINLATGGTAKSSSLTKVLGKTSVNRPTASGVNPRQTFGLLQVPAGDKPAVIMEIPAGGLTRADGSVSTDVTLTWLNPLPREGAPFGDLYGPLQTYTAWDSNNQSGTKGTEIVAFAPVNFADLDLGGATITPGYEIKITWAVGPEVLKQYPIPFSNGQAFMPCYQYEDGEGWTKPVLATVFEDGGYTWTRYSMRGSNPPVVQ